MAEVAEMIRQEVRRRRLAGVSSALFVYRIALCDRDENHDLPRAEKAACINPERRWAFPKTSGGHWSFF